MAGRRLRRALAGARGARPGSVPEVLAAQGPAALRAATLLRVAFFFPVYFAALRLPDVPRLADPQGADLLWPVAWVGVTGDPGALAPLALALGMTGNVVGALFPGSRLARAAALVGLLQLLGLNFSFGKIHHLMHGWVYLLALTLWLPSGWTRPEGLSRAGRQEVLLVFGAAQSLIALTYTLAGVGKICGTVYQLARGEVTPFHPEALARHLADRLLQTRPESVLGPWLIDHATLLWPMMLGTIYLQLFALWAVFRPRLHVLWGAGLLLFHVMTGLSLTIDFSPSILLVGLLFLASPFAPRWAGAGPVLHALPGAGLLRTVSRLWARAVRRGPRLGAAGRSTGWPLGLIALTAAAAATSSLASGCAGGAVDRHQDHRDEATRRCLDRCELYSPNDPNCQRNCYPYLVNTDEVRDARDARERERQERQADPDPNAPEPTSSPRPPEPLFEVERYDEDDGGGR